MTTTLEIEPERQTAAEALSGEQVAAQTILQRSVCLILRCGRVGTTRSVSLADVAMEKDGQALDAAAKATKSLRERMVGSHGRRGANPLHAANQAVDAVRNYFASRSAGGHGVFGPGTYLLPLVGLPETLARARALRENVTTASAALAGQWDALVAARLSQPGTLLKAADFPTAAEVADAFSVSWTFVSFSAPERLAEVDAAAYDAAVAESQAQLAGALDDVIVGLRQAAVNVLRELADRLGDGADGTPRPLRASALRDLDDLVANLPSLNSIGQDGALVAALARVRAVSQGVDVETLRKAPAVRHLLLEAASRAAAELAELGTAPTRGIRFGALAASPAGQD